MSGVVEAALRLGKAQRAFASPGSATIIGPVTHLAGRGEIWHLGKNRTGMLSNFSGKKRPGRGWRDSKIAQA
jgi:hypothetical protein